MQSTMGRLRQRREELGDQGGFTLIELLIVIVILGILAAIVVFAVQNLTGSSAQSACKSDYKTVETAVEAYNAQVGHYPVTTGATPDATNYTGTGSAVHFQPAGDQMNTLMVAQGSVGPFLRDFPANGSHYQIAVFANAVAGQTPVIAVYKTNGVTGAGGSDPTAWGSSSTTAGSAADCSAVS
jgi:general secretion pathway protein G